jgi:multisubunit Na+/H+ antiporter MnhE subunit
MRRVTAWLAWFAALLLLWLAFAGTIQSQEVIAGLCAAALGATAAEVVRSQGLLRFRIQWRWLRELWKPLLRVVPDFFVVIAALVRRPAGRMRRVEFPTGGTRDVDAGGRAFVAVAASLAPNSLVIDVDAEQGIVLVHDLVPGSAPQTLP